MLTPSCLNVHLNGSAATIHVTEQDFSFGSGECFSHRLLRFVEDSGWREVLVDCSAVRFLGSMGLATLLMLRRKLKDAGGSLAVVNVQPQVYDVFQVSGLVELLGVRRLQESAA